MTNVYQHLLNRWLLARAQRQLKSVWETPLTSKELLAAQSLKLDWEKICATSRLTMNRPIRKPQTTTSYYWLALPLVCGAAAVVLTFLHYQSTPSTESEQTFKSANGDIPHLPMPHLRFASVSKTGQLQAGEQNMRVALGSQIIFSVETSALPKNEELKIAIVCHLPEGSQKTIVSDYPLQAGLTHVRGPSGHLAFQPEAKGVYTFFIESAGELGKTAVKLDQTSTNIGKFSIHVE